MQPTRCEHRAGSQSVAPAQAARGNVSGPWILVLARHASTALAAAPRQRQRLAPPDTKSAASGARRPSDQLRNVQAPCGRQITHQAQIVARLLRRGNDRPAENDRTTVSIVLHPILCSQRSGYPQTHTRRAPDTVRARGECGELACVGRTGPQQARSCTLTASGFRGYRKGRES